MHVRVIIFSPAALNEWMQSDKQAAIFMRGRYYAEDPLCYILCRIYRLYLLEIELNNPQVCARITTMEMCKMQYNYAIVRGLVPITQLPRISIVTFKGDHKFRSIQMM